MRMESIIALDVRITRWMARHGPRLLRIHMIRQLALILTACTAAACSPKTQPDLTKPGSGTSATIAVPDPSFDILVAAADSVLPQLGPPDRKFYVDDSVTAKVLDYAGATDRYTRIAKDQQVSCDGSTAITGTRASMRVYGLFGDSASVAWSATCLLVPPGRTEARAAGSGGTFNLAKTGDSWIVTGAGLLFQF